jgi:hypothetical protein
VLCQNPEHRLTCCFTLGARAHPSGLPVHGPGARLAGTAGHGRRRGSHPHPFWKIKNVRQNGCVVPRYVKRVLTWLGAGVDVVGAHVNYKIADSYGCRVLAFPGGSAGSLARSRCHAACRAWGGRAVSVTAPGPPSVARRVPVRGPHELPIGLGARERADRIRASQCICAGQRLVVWAKERGL